MWVREKEEKDKREGSIGRRYHGNIWWCHGKVNERVLETGAEGTLTCFSVETCCTRQVHSSRSTAKCYLFPFWHRPTHVTWLSASVLYHFIFAICVPSNSTNHVPSQGGNRKQQSKASPMTCRPWGGSVILLQHCYACDRQHTSDHMLVSLNK